MKQEDQLHQECSEHSEYEASCPNCNGRGTFNCSSCGGSGLMNPADSSSLSCSFCGGDGTVNCSQCGGSGQV